MTIKEKCCFWFVKKYLDKLIKEGRVNEKFLRAALILIDAAQEIDKKEVDFLNEKAERYVQELEDTIKEMFKEEEKKLRREG